jgi:hypothetical protein
MTIKFNDLLIDLQIDEEEFATRNNDFAIADFKLLRQYVNSIGFSEVELGSTLEENGESISTMSFNLIARSHPKCEFEWISLMVNVSLILDGRIVDMFPPSTQYNEAVKYTVTKEDSMKFNYEVVKIGPINQKSTTEYNVYLDQIIATGNGLQQANWDFKPIPPNKLHLQNQIKVKFSHRKNETDLRPTINIEASVALNNDYKILRRIPLIGSGTFDLTRRI